MVLWEPTTMLNKLALVRRWHETSFPFCPLFAALTVAKTLNGTGFHASQFVSQLSPASFLVVIVVTRASANAI